VNNDDPGINLNNVANVCINVIKILMIKNILSSKSILKYIKIKMYHEILHK